MLRNDVNTIADVRTFNRLAGRCWFSAESMKFFNSKIESELYKGYYFITSERMELDYPKQYTIRHLHADGHISTASKFQEFNNIEDARNFIKQGA